ncbi:SEC-C domain-containing protein [bacterium]|nr:SEC-C domain-containing protein [bacterium]
MQNAIGGFSSHRETYDVALWMDSKRGLYIIPFLETFFKCFEGEADSKKECIQEFLTSDKVPPSVLKYAHDKYENFFEVINSALNTKFETFEEILFNTKTAFIDSGVYSPVSVLFNSELFSSLVGLKDEIKKEYKTRDVVRNEPCPCGSGLKYKNCCGKN